VSFATYFNAFPASYWRRWTTCTSVVLRTELTGKGRVDVYRTKATGARIFVDGRNFAAAGSEPEILEFQIGLDPFETAGGSGSTSPPTPSWNYAVPAGIPTNPRRVSRTSRSGSRPSPAERLRQRAA